ncbi:hypothetical protein [Mycobacteroides abscessus]|uniref:hypothetical protein n=1 Tax=Mycobacteroides abscessus TaxID=36809 RepID=UPI000927A6B8|nr:hypothetical protein [Mycobacteroides abscessus]SHR31618.1 Uncharacterised protein [Mycobacteroides abscessus subsp. bolletii]SHT33880.1 Uncharacterised protein [Mycobacteroides abscessus subsp. bolletii]SHT52073.1 Uncharacterised protein [Mycobacteroides abscessus subsp. bolletii]SKG65397.1 Uncharacterised protein [Mycobacteroides abscessus subsp. bolletii]SKH20458.1 Uncharacterised protein [Mycobacteroides abscessus subsp. bolletii]
MDAGDWINLAGVVVSASAAIWAAVSASKSKTAQDEATKQAGIATQAAVDAAGAEQRSADAAERSANALEEQNQMAADQAAIAEGVPWSIRYRSGSTYELWNDSDTPKFAVRVSGPGIRGEVTAEQIHGRSCITFMNMAFWGAKNDQVVVNWHRLASSGDPELSWSGTVPAKQ